MGVIEPTDEPTEWTSSLVVANKANGELRVCIDPHGLSRTIKRVQHPYSGRVRVVDISSQGI